MEEECDSDDNHPMSFLSADGTHSVGTRKDFINSIGRENVRWVFNDQGVRYAVDARVYPEGEEPFNQYGRLSDIFPPEAGYGSE